MTRRLLLTFSTAFTLFGVYAVYALTISPLFTPESVEQAPQQVRAAPPPAPESANRQMASRWLGDHAWAADAKYQVRTAQAFVYAEDWEKVLPAGDVRFRPFALIYVSADHPEREPMVVVSDSALVKFTAPFDESNPKPGRVVAGALEGKVEIRGAEGLAIKTRNLNFSEAALRAWSDEPIDFRYGLNHGQGLGLELDLIPGTPTDDKPGISGLRTVRVRRDVILNLASKPKPGRRQERLKITSSGNFEYRLEEKLASFRENVHVEHPGENGQFDQLDCADLVVMFEAKAKPPAEPGAPSPEAVAKVDGAKEEDEDLDFRRLRGLGDAARGQPARLVSKRAGLVAYCGELTYDRVLRVATLRDGNQVTVLQKNNELRCPEITIVHAEKGDIVEALCRGAGRIDSYATAEKAGTVTRGETGAQGETGRGPLEFTGSWTKQLHKHPDAETGLDLIQFEGDARLSQPKQLTLGGETIQVWVTPDKPGALKDQAAPGPSADDSQPKPDTDRTAQVKRVVAVKQVSFDGDRIRGKTDRLEITVVEGKLPLQPPSGLAQGSGTTTSWNDRGLEATPAFETLDEVVRNRSRLVLTSGRRPVSRSTDRTRTDRSATGRALMAVGDEPVAGNGPMIRPGAGEPRSGVVPAGGAGVMGAAARDSAPPRKLTGIGSGGSPGEVPGAAPSRLPTGPIPTGPAEKPAAEPVHVAADVIHVTMVRDGKEMEASKVETEGHVVVTQPRAGQPPVEVVGDWLELLNYSKTQQVVHVKGNPARILDSRMDLEGADLHLDTTANQSRVEGAGLLRLPVTKGLDGKPLLKPEKLNVRWERRMEFDGLVARFFVGVEAKLDENKMTCHEMDVTFSRRISFSEGSDVGGSRPDSSGPGGKSGAAGPAADVKTIHCKEGVEVFAYEHDPDRKLKAFRKGSMWDMTFDQQSGDTVALGPGTMTMWWKGDAAREGLASTAVVRANAGRKTERAEWNYAKIDFAETMTGNTNVKATLFRERVTIVYGPVNSMAESINPDKLPNNGGWLRCAMLRLTQTTGTTGKDHFEMVGTGNAELDGQTKNGTFHALADMVSFDESKGLYILRSEGNRLAKVWRQLSPGREPQTAESQRLDLNPEQNSLRSHNTRTLDGLE